MIYTSYIALASRNSTMSNFNGAPRQSDPLKQEQFNSAEDSAFDQARERVLARNRDFVETDKNREESFSAPRTVQEEQDDIEWKNLLLNTEATLGSIGNPDQRKLLQANPVMANDATYFLASQTSSWIDSRHLAKNIPDDVQEVWRSAEKDDRKLFVETGKRLYPEVELSSNNVDTIFGTLKNDAMKFSSKELKDWLQDFPVHGAANSSMNGSPDKFLSQVESFIQRGADSIGRARKSSDPVTSMEIAAVGKGLYALELLRQDLEQRVQERKEPKIQHGALNTDEELRRKAAELSKLNISGEMSADTKAKLEAHRAKMGLSVSPEVQQGIPVSEVDPVRPEATPEEHPNTPQTPGEKFFAAKEAELKGNIQSFFEEENAEFSKVEVSGPAFVENPEKLEMKKDSLQRAEALVKRLLDPKSAEDIRDNWLENIDETNNLSQFFTNALTKEIQGSRTAPKEGGSRNIASSLFKEIIHKRLYPYLSPLPPAATLSSRGFEQFKNPALKYWGESLTNDGLTVNEPEALLEKLESAITHAASQLELAQSDTVNPPTSLELRMVGERILGIELLRSAIKQKLELRNQ